MHFPSLPLKIIKHLKEVEQTFSKSMQLCEQRTPKINNCILGNNLYCPDKKLKWLRTDFQDVNLYKINGVEMVTWGHRACTGETGELGAAVKVSFRGSSAFLEFRVTVRLHLQRRKPGYRGQFKFS